jgi:hypothetical protein
MEKISARWVEFPVIRTNKFGEHVVIEKCRGYSHPIYHLIVDKHKFDYSGTFSECLKWGKLSYEEARWY